MNNIFKFYLFQKHFLVNDLDTKVENSFEANFAFAGLLAIKIGKGKDLACTKLVKFASDMLGINVPKPFYEGFPQSVRKLTKEQLLFDQLLSYYNSYDLNDFENPEHSFFEENFTRTAFKEGYTIKNFDILTEKEAEKELHNQLGLLLTSTRPLSEDQYNLVLNAVAIYNFTFEECPCKDTAIRLLIDRKNLDFVKFLSLQDFVKVVECVNFYLNGSVNINKLNLKNKERVFLTKILDLLLERKELHTDYCYEKKKAWCGILHHLHYKPKNERAKTFIDSIRNGKNQSISSLFENAIDKGDIKLAVNTLIKNKGTSAFMRSINYILSRCETEEDIAFVLKEIKTKNNIVLIQLLLQYANYKSDGARSFKFPKFNMLKQHTESLEEIKNRKSVIKPETIEKIVKIIKQNLENNLKGKLGKVYIDEKMKSIAIPLQESTSMGGFGTLPKGSTIDIEKDKKVRAFTYWEKVNDIDLSVIGIDENFKQHEFSWRTMYGRQSKAITFSGDQTSGYNGGSEYFDLDLEALKKQNPTIRYYVLCNNVFSGYQFSCCYCRAGYMFRDKLDSGEVFEPKTVNSSYLINANSTFCYLFAIDVVDNKIIWLNVARDSSEKIAGTTSISFLIDYLTIVKVISAYDIYTMLATKVVDNPLDADVVVTDEEIEVKEGTEIIRSYETEKLLPLIN